MNEDSFKLISGFKTYVSKPEITALAPNYLVKGSKNVLIDYASRVISRNGYTLFGASNSGGGGIKSSYEWDSSTGRQYAFRVYDGKIEFLLTSIRSVFGIWSSGSYPWLAANPWTITNTYTYNFNLLKSGFPSSNFEFATIWDDTEKLDMLLWVIGSTNTYRWSGGVTKVRDNPTPGTTLRKQGVLTAVTTIAFVAGVAGSVAPTITDSANNFLNAGFAAGDTLYVTGSTNNSRNFTIGSVVAGTITLIMSDVLTTEAAGPAITAHNGEPTWASSRFLTSYASRKIVYNGVEYAYTGGEGTDTLTGLTAFPTVTLGDVVWQSVDTLANPGAIPATFKQDLISVQLNQLILASTKSREIYISSNADYRNFTLTSPRAPGDPAKLTMDNYATCIIPIDNLAKTTSSVAFGAGTSEFFQMSYQLAQDNAAELIRMIKLKTANGSGLISRSAIAPIKNATVYITREPSLDMLSNIESIDSKSNVPISDLIKNDFDSYDFTNAHVKYWKRSIFISLPAHGLVLIYDKQRNLWQPPQTIPIGRFAIINDWLYGHSSITNETYKLFVGTDDNGIFIPQVARFAYNNGGRRDRLKNMSEYWSDGYITASGELTMTVDFGFDGSEAKKVMTISGGDTSITTPQKGSMIGDEAFGSNPLGGATLDPITGLPGAQASLLRFWQEDTMKAVDYTEHFVEYSMNTLGGQFAIVAHGSNQWDAGTSPNTHKK